MQNCLCDCDSDMTPPIRYKREANYDNSEPQQKPKTKILKKNKNV